METIQSSMNQLHIKPRRMLSYFMALNKPPPHPLYLLLFAIIYFYF